MTGLDSTASRIVLQEYWNLLHDAALSRDLRTRDVRLLRAWGVCRYLLSGPMNCAHCRTQVRLAIPITSERLSGETLEYACLCTNCTFKELELARRITMEVGSVRVEYPHEEDNLSP
jgi:hypothetical protein